MRKIFTVIAELLALVLIVVAAFYAPQIIFQVQDTLICSKTDLSKREKVDVEALSTTYEKSLNRRMQNFADDLEAGDNFYVTSQELTLNQELYEYLYSESGMYQELISEFIDIGLISFPFVESIWDENCTVNRWLQYVIYSDNYTKGVNFILWYIELQDEENEIMKLLVDAETGTLYAMKTENAIKTRKKPSKIYNYFHDEFWSEDMLPSTWLAFAYYYEIKKEEVFKEAYKNSTENGYELPLKLQELWDFDEDGNYVSNNDAIMNEVIYVYKLMTDKFKLEENTMRFQLPYGGTSLEVLLEIEEGDDWHPGFPDVIFGVSQIYEMIPEFA